MPQSNSQLVVDEGPIGHARSQLLLDKVEDRDTVSTWLPLLRCLARRVMKNDFKEYLEYLNEDGTIPEEHNA